MYNMPCINVFYAHRMMYYIYDDVSVIF